MKKGMVYFVGAGPGDPELITIKGMKLLKEADIIIYAGSLVNPKLLSMKRENALIYNSASMDLEEISAIMINSTLEGKTVIRLQTGDLSFYSALHEQLTPLKQHHIEFEVIPGVSSATASACAIQKELTFPSLTQTVIFSRISGRTPVPKKESIPLLSTHNATLCLFLSIGMIDKVVGELKTGYAKDTPVSVIYKATWQDQKIVAGTLMNIAKKVKDAKIDRQSIIIVGDALKDERDEGLDPSKLYDKTFTHGYRTGEPGVSA